jgi:hypothetical protein
VRRWADWWSDVRGRNRTGPGITGPDSLLERIRSRHDARCRFNHGSKGSFVIPAIFEELTRLGYVEGRSLLVERYCETMARNARRLLAHCGLRGEQSNDTID